MTTWRLIRSSVAALAVAVAGAGLTTPAVATPVDTVVAPAAESDDERPSYLGKSYYTGEFHSHTSVSDGAELPPDAFEHVQSETDADFFTVSEHDVMWDIRNGDDFIDDWRDADSDEWRWLHEQTDSFNASQQDLVVVPSIENTWYDGTGHINVFNADWHATARATEQGSNDGFGNSFGTGDMKYDMYTFFARLKLDPEAIGQFNHPSAGGKGNFFGFNGLDPVVDDRMDLIEVKVEGHFAEYQRALDAGWHVGPVWNGDEHQANWVSGNESITGVWASEHSLDGLYGAMHDRSVFTSQDVNTVLRFGADGHLMGSILPADTTALSFDVGLSDPDDADEFTSVRIYTNDGEVAHEFSDVSGNEVQFELDRDVTAGDYYYVRAEQADGQFVVSAPVWIGETTRGANYAPEISIEDDVPAQASYGQSIDLPAVTATDDSGEEPTRTYEVYDAAGEIQVHDGEFTVRSYDDHFIVVKAEDGTGNINAELIRITVDRSSPDPAGVFQYFGSTAAVAEQPGGAGIAVSTDRSIEQVYAQVRPAGQDGWSAAPVLTSTNDRPYEVNTIGNDEPVYQHSITGQTLRSHEFDVTGLDDGRRYEYRLGVAVDGGAPDPSETSAWTGVQEEFVAGGAGNEPVYVLGDLQAKSHDPADLGLLRQVLDRLRSERPGGTAAVQLGDLVDNGGRGQYWQEVHDHVFDGLDLQIAPVAGNHETYGDLDYNALSGERTAIFSNMYDLPENGAIGESNYSFDRGDVHFSVLNSNVDFDEQLDWLIDDVRASTATWHVVMGHFSYYGGSHAADPGMAVNRDKITGVLDQLGVDLYLGAHDHTYKRSTIYDGRLAQTPAEEAAGTTFVTMGSSGPKFYENVPYWWDDVVFDEDVQMGGVVEVTDAGLELSVHTVDGRTVDTYTVRKPRGIWKLSSAAAEGRELPGVGLLSYPGSRETVTVTAATYDNAQQQVIEMRSMEVRLDHTGVEQYVAFDEPLPVRPSDTLKVFVWDRLENGKPLRPALVREGIAGEGTPDDPYLIDSADDLVKIDNDPDGHYLLTADLDLSDHERPQIGRAATFTGVFDGGGHTVSGFTAFPEHGVGIFAENHGTIRNLVVDGNAEAPEKDTAGLLADINYGTVERVRVQGSITAEDRVGGVAGDHYGVVRDSYSTADVHATDRYSGGVVGIAIGGSVTENVYAGGRVTADGRNAGGVVSYGYNETVVRHVVSLNRAVSAPSYGHAIVGRVANGQVAVLEDNHTSAAVPVSGQSLTDPPAADNWHGAVVPVDEVRTQAFFEQRGWDFGTVWEWNESGRRPVLQVAPEDVEPIPAPTLPTDDRGFYIVDSVDDLAQVGEHPGYDYALAADLDLSGAPFTSLDGPFVGEFDGAGHTITGLRSETGGLFTHIAGSVHDLAVVDADISTTSARAGILADTSTGTVERVYTTGSVSAGSRAGGILGDSGGVLRDAYSTAAVHVSATEAGGAVGVALTGSTTERVYALGDVSSDTRNVGGLAGYGYTGTEIRDSLALAPTVTAPTYAHRFLGRVLSGDTATLANNWASEGVLADVQAVSAVGADTLNGATATRAQSRDQGFYTGQLGWDFTTTWAWDEDGRRPVLQSVPEDVPAAPEPSLPQDTDGAYLVADADDFAEVAAFPDRSFRLAGDVDLTGQDARVSTAFSGDFDGAGHAITGYTSSAGGVFAAVTGSVHDVTLADATVDTTASNVGLLVDRNDGVIERAATSGSISGGATVGAVTGYSCATIRDSYSTADVTATNGRQAGGIVGIAGGAAQCSVTGGSVTERTYAAGRVEVVGDQNAGGISGYTYTGTTIRDSIALNPAVVATGYAHRIAARTFSGNTATLAGNYASEAVDAAVQTIDETGPGTLNGETVTAAAAAAQATYVDLLGWDFDGVWQWDDTRGAPVLRSPSAGAEQVSSASRPAASTHSTRVTPAVAVDPAVAAGGGIGHDAIVNDDGTVTVTVHAGDEAAGQQAGVVILPVDGDLAQPSAEDVVYLNEVTLDAAGDGAFTLVLPQGETADFAITVNTSGESGRYLAVLDPGGSLPWNGSAELTARVTPEQPKAGRNPVTARVEVTNADGVPVAGTVTVDAEGIEPTTATIVKGRVRLRLPVFDTAGSHDLTISYNGSGELSPATITQTVNVRP